MGCIEKEKFPNSAKQSLASGNAIVDQRTWLEFREAGGGRGALIPSRDIGKSKAAPQGCTEMGGQEGYPERELSLSVG